MQRLLAGGLAVLLVVALSAAVSLSVARGSAPRSPKAERAHKEAAKAAVREMLEDVQVPPGATAYPAEPPGTNSILDEPPASFRPRTIVARARWWVSPLNTEETLQWIEEHPPLGSRLLSVGETGSGAPGAKVAHTLDVGWPPVRGVLQRRHLVFAAVDRQDGKAVLTVAAQVEWTVPHPDSARIPGAARFLEVEATDADETHRRYTIGGPRVVGRVAAVIDALPARQPQQIRCPRDEVPPPTVRLRFRRARGRPVLAEAEQRWPPGYCRFFELTVHGRPQLPLSEGNRVADAVQSLLKRPTRTRALRPPAPGSSR